MFRHWNTKKSISKRLVPVVLLYCLFLWHSFHSTPVKSVKSPDSIFVRPDDLDMYPEPTGFAEIMREHGTVVRHISQNGESSRGATKSDTEKQTVSRGHSQRAENMAKLVGELVTIISKNKPAVSPESVTKPNPLQQDAVLTHEVLSAYMDFQVTYLKELKKSYMSFLADMKELVKSVDLSYLYRGRGLAIAADKSSAFVTLNNLHFLNSLGNKYEVDIVTTEDGVDLSSIESLMSDAYFDIRVYNLTTMLDENQRKIINPHNSPQIKNLLAMMVSTTAEKIFMSSTSAILMNPTHFLYPGDPLAKTGLLMWPSVDVVEDLRRMTHPKFYEITNKNITAAQRARVGLDEAVPTSLLNAVSKQDANIPLQDLEGSISETFTTTEHLVINSRTHLETLMLSIYFSAYEEWFAPLAQMEGGVEVFRSDIIKIAASSLDKPFYQIKTKGRKISKDGISLSYDSVTDYQQFSKYKIKLETIFEDNFRKTQAEFYDFLQSPQRAKMNAFLGNVTILADPFKLYAEKLYFTQPANIRRKFLDHDRLITVNPGFNYEHFYFEVMYNDMCMPNSQHAARKGHQVALALGKSVHGYELENVCESIQAHMEFLIGM